MFKKSIKKKAVILIYLVLSLILIEGFQHYKELKNIPKLIFASSETSRIVPTIAPISTTPLESFIAPILIYHYVEYVTDERDTIRKSLNIVPSIFERQVFTLQNAGYTFVTPKDIIDMLDGKLKLPQKPVVLSFDDGYRDFYTDVFPILKKYQAKAVAYIVSGFLDKPNYMFTWQLKEVARSGLVEIGAHTVNHASLKGAPSHLAKYEIEESKKELEKLLNIPIVSFAYPDGQFDESVAKLVEETGFTSAVTTIHGNIANQRNKYFLYRIRPGHNVDNLLLNFLEKSE
ncbi:MAG: polysaccharide deacetylase family protein [Candidatus Levybacteria bacterium]|nr:polysaccharide deacetylase family protein [Candidatus Levybacteria bacterium]